jgi:integrase
LGIRSRRFAQQRALWLAGIARQIFEKASMSNINERVGSYDGLGFAPGDTPQEFLRNMRAHLDDATPLSISLSRLRVSIFDVANRRFVALGVEAAHRGGHALRHACAVRVLAEGLTLKEIGDHLGHRSTSATSVYAKVNVAALREVGAFDLGDVL